MLRSIASGKSHMKTPVRLAAAVFALSLATTAASFGAEWRYSYGVHDMVVAEVDSHTLGLNATILVEETTSSGVHLAGVGELFLDHDKDDLDPDHIPVWWRTHLSADGRLWDLTQSLGVSWVADINTKANTVSCVEREMKALPGVMLNYRAGPVQASLKGAGGFFFLEIDDDVPKERGYTRGDFRNSTFAGSFAGHVSVELGERCLLTVQAQNWFDGDTWLENQFVAELRYHLGASRKGSALVLGYEITEYNLDIYTPASTEGASLPILPWDDDQFLKLSFEKPW